MKEVNGKEVYIGMKVYDLSINKNIEDYAPPDIISEIHSDKIILENGKQILWKGPGYFLPVAIK